MVSKVLRLIVHRLGIIKLKTKNQSTLILILDGLNPQKTVILKKHGMNIQENTGMLKIQTKIDNNINAYINLQYHKHSFIILGCFKTTGLRGRFNNILLAGII